VPNVAGCVWGIVGELDGLVRDVVGCGETAFGEVGGGGISDGIEERFEVDVCCVRCCGEEGG